MAAPPPPVCSSLVEVGHSLQTGIALQAGPAENADTSSCAQGPIPRSFLPHSEVGGFGQLLPQRSFLLAILSAFLRVPSFPGFSPVLLQEEG